MHVSKGLLLAVPCKLCFYLSNNALAKHLHHCSLLPSFPPETSQAPALVSGLCRDTTSWCSAPHKCLFHSRLRTSPAWLCLCLPHLHILSLPKPLRCLWLHKICKMSVLQLSSLSFSPPESPTFISLHHQLSTHFKFNWKHIFSLACGS